jgi:hypothetical protein
MEKREITLYIITIISIIAVICIFFVTIFKTPNISNEKTISLTGNTIKITEETFKVGDSLKGEIIFNSKETNEIVYGIILLTKDKHPIKTETFPLEKNQNSIQIENLIGYQFEETGTYKILFSVLDLDINIQKTFIVE